MNKRRREKRKIKREKDIKKEYLKHLQSSMVNHKQNCLNQMGKSDIEPPNYREIIERWYSDLNIQIRAHQPDWYVRSINVFEQAGKIVDIEYNYFEEDEKLYESTVNIYNNR